jgi:hypothetical protein
VKFMIFWQFSREDDDKVIAKNKSFAEERKKFSDKFPKEVYPAHWMGIGEKSFSVYETIDERQIQNLMMHYFPEVKFEIVPIFPISMFPDSLGKGEK